MIVRILQELRQYGIVTVIQHVRMVLTQSLEATYAYYYAIHKNRGLKELEVELAEVFKKSNLYEMDFANPETYCQKVYWIRLYGATPLKTKLADKYLCREYIADKIGEQYNIPLLGVWDDFNEIDFEQLPKQFVLKTNHGCGFNLIIKDKDKINKKKIKRKINRWMQMNYAMLFCEMQYYNIPRKIIAERYLEQLDGGLNDYKFHCFNGEPLFCELIGERDWEKGSGKQSIYDCKWNLLEFTFGDYEPFEDLIDKPKCLEEMVDIARKLSCGIDYVRVDLYEVEDRVYVGELTFTATGGNTPNISPKSADGELGKLICLDKPYYVEIIKEK